MGRMEQDISDILKGWPHDSGRVNARLIPGKDGRQKLQLRLDIGLLQMELDGRPDGQRPGGFESWFELFADRLRRYEAEHGDDEGFALDEEDCGRLQQEAVQFYHRYLSLFQLEDWKRVIRDTSRNLAVFDFVADFAETDEQAWSLQQFRPYVLMMHARASAMLEIREGKLRDAVRRIDKAIAEIEAFLSDTDQEEAVAESAEIALLREFREELKSKIPASPRERVRRLLDQAIAREEYEQAARLRDELAALDNGTESA